ncbi:MAG TPA: DMT family transporter [Steroidobacteraceae bacterium]|nr:DMT family transporter [Steroidobacteraceae bacterium]
MQYAAMAATALVGASLAVQIGLNATMSRHAGSPMVGAFINFAVGTVLLFLILLFSRGSLPLIAQAATAPWWAWGAGALGALFIATSIVVGPMIGGATFLALLVAGQMFAALAIDHYGVIGFPVRTIDGLRIAGAILVIAGVFLLARR